MSRAEPVASEASRDSGARAKVQGEGKRGGEPLGVTRTLLVEERTEHMEGKQKTDQNTVCSEALRRTGDLRLCLLSAETKVVHHPA